MAGSPNLFGLKNSNRDFSLPSSWGKNQFNSSFPAALACFMSSRSLEPIYMKLDKNLQVVHDNITVADTFGIDPLSSEVYFSFESVFSPFEGLVYGKLPRIDLITSKIDRGLTSPLRPFEVKLTALPDNQTADNSDEDFGSEIVVRPDTIVYLAISLALVYKNEKPKLLSYLEPLARKISNWGDADIVCKYTSSACDAIDALLKPKLEFQKPLMLQPIWKTEGKRLVLNDNCLDMFVWSDFAFTRLFIDTSRGASGQKISRHQRCTIWLAKMLYDFAKTGKIHHKKIIDECTYNTKNDKAFAVGGSVTKKYMKTRGFKPRVKKQEIKNIILGGGEKLLSPERRFDAALVSTPGLFDK